MDLIYQALVLDQFFPGEAVIVALLLAVVPYMAIRGVANCIAGRLSGGPSARRREET